MMDRFRVSGNWCPSAEGPNYLLGWADVAKNQQQMYKQHSNNYFIHFCPTVLYAFIEYNIYQ